MNCRTLLLGLALTAPMGGCDQQPKVETANEAEIMNFVNGSLDAPVTVDGLVQRRGHFQVTIPGRPQHDMVVQVQSMIVRGDEDVIMTVSDLTDQSEVVYSLNNEDGVAQITTPAATVLNLTVNADETYAIGDQAYETPEALGTALAANPDAASMSPEHLATAIAVANDGGLDTGMDTSRAEIVYLLLVAVIKALVAFFHAVACALLPSC